MANEFGRSDNILKRFIKIPRNWVFLRCDLSWGISSPIESNSLIAYDGFASFLFFSTEIHGPQIVNYIVWNEMPKKIWPSK